MNHTKANNAQFHCRKQEQNLSFSRCSECVAGCRNHEIWRPVRSYTVSFSRQWLSITFLKNIKHFPTISWNPYGSTRNPLQCQFCVNFIWVQMQHFAILSCTIWCLIKTLICFHILKIAKIFMVTLKTWILTAYIVTLLIFGAYSHYKKIMKKQRHSN